MIKKAIVIVFIITSFHLSQTKIALMNIDESVTDSNELKSMIVFLNNNGFIPDILNSEKILKSKFLTSQNTYRSRSIHNYKLLWIHRSNSSEFSRKENDPDLIQKIKEYVNAGGTLFLTLDAVKYLTLLNYESVEPTIKYVNAIDDGYGRKLGFHAFRDHPIFAGMNGGAYLFNPTSDMKTRQIGFFENNVPEEGKVVAVDWSYITMKEDSRLVVEYEIGKGKVLAVGAYTYFAVPNNNKQHLELFVKNCLNYLLGKFEHKKKYFWNYKQNSINEFSMSEQIREDSISKSTFSQLKSWNRINNGLQLTSQFATDNFWNVAGKRMLIMGKEKGGIDEIWAHPFMALKDYEVGIQFSYKDTVFWLNEQRPQIEVKPESFSRVYKFRRAYLTEIITSSPDNPSAVIHYEYRGVYPATLIIKFKSNLRFMWPYSEKVFNSINYAWNEDLNAFVIKDDSDEHFVFAGSNRKPYQQIIGQIENFVKPDSFFISNSTNEFKIGALAQYKLSMNDNLDFIITSSNEGYKSARNEFVNAKENPEAIYSEAIDYSEKFLAKTLSLTTPDKTFNEGFNWALVGADKFFVHTPGIGKALVAGYSTTEKGWNGGHKVNGRPGYAWYFGRDAVWSSFALLDYGDFEKVKSQLEFFNRYQDLNGKIFHELTTSGVVHYDASDATPLYLILAGRYLLHSGDIDFIKQTWYNIKKAIEYCFSTDTDKDHLIENTNVGHGWVEGGGLYTAHTEVYLAACWAEALRMSSIMAKTIGYYEESEVYKSEFDLVKKLINEDFWNSEKSFLNFSKLKNGKFNSEKTVLASVPIYFDLIDSSKARNVIDDFSENYFSADWGVRILREDSPIYNPRGYHTGSVWPLFTGWSSLAEFKYGNYLQGYSHVMNNLLVYKNWQLGSIEEVLHGSEYRPSGVCSHQCWSQTMVLQPAIEGMLGLEINALQNSIKLEPRLPADWDSLKIERIRIANSSVDFLMKRINGKISYIFKTESETPINIEFKPILPHNTIIESIVVNKNEIAVSKEFCFSVDRNNSIKLEIFYSGGISVLPNFTLPKPNYTSEGFRILDDKIVGNEYIIYVQGKTGTENELKIWYSGEIKSLNVHFEKSNEKYLNKEIKIKL
jgi:glycogen debranching enzyme